MTIVQKLRELGFDPGSATTAFANYLPYKCVGDQLYVAGQLAVFEGKIQFKGRLGQSLSLQECYQAARLCGINLLLQAVTACAGDETRLLGCVKLVGFVNSTASFTEQAKVVNGASDLMVEAFGDAGKHARSAVGVYRLPLGFSVEVDAVVQVR